MGKTNKGRRLFYLLLVLTIFLSLNVTAFAQEGRGPVNPDALRLVAPFTPVSEAGAVVGKLENGERLISVIVKLEDEPLASYRGGIAGLAATSIEVTGAPRLDAKAPESQAYLNYLTTKQKTFEAQLASAIPAAKVLHRYQAVINGLSMVVPESQLSTLRALPGVKAVYLDRVEKVVTDSSPDFIGAPTVWNALGGQESAGEGIIVGMLDTGIWPEHPSFSDPDPSGKPYDPPSGGPYACDFGDTTWNPNDAPFTCNNKLIGAYRFMDTYDFYVGIEPEEFRSARDDDGHGTHTSSTAAGNAGVQASVMGSDLGIISGIAPRAKVIAYKVCGMEGCYVSDSAAAVEQAILDGVNVINFSISGGTNPYSDAVSLAFLDAFNAGVFVAASAGNSGPAADTVNHREPWVTTVAASTQERTFVGTVHVEADNGDTLDLEGVSITGGTTATIVVAADYGDAMCNSPFPPGTWTNNEIVVCERGVIARVEKGYNVLQGGAGGMVLYNPSINTLNADNHFLPAVHIDEVAGADLLNFLASHTGEVATLAGGIKTTDQGDVMAAFSSRGGPGQTLGINKPDITAPGVNILAGHTPMPATIAGGAPGQLFQVIAGTSMSSPHIAGAGALLKALHPDWTPAQIKSALMTTAWLDGVVKEDGVTPVDPFDVGSGRVDLNKAGQPGLTFNVSGADYLALENELWNANYPSLYVPVMPGQITVQRTVHNETNKATSWRLTFSAPPDVKIYIPKVLNVPPGGDATFSITVDARLVPEGEVRHAMIYFRRGTHVLHFPVTLVRQQPGVTLEKSCDPTTLAKDGTTDCTITLSNNTYADASVYVKDRLPKQLRLDPATVVGGTALGYYGVEFSGTLAGAGAPSVDVADSVYNSYLSLASLGVPPFDLPSNPDDGGWILSGLDFYYLGQHYTDLIWSVNGTIEAGSASGLAASATNTALPNAALPNNLLAAWWTDLDLTNSGNWYGAILTDGYFYYYVFEWENVPRWGDPSSTATFQIWIVEGTDYIWYSYGGWTGDTSDGTIGAEDADGLFGDTYYYGEGGIGSLPLPLHDLDVIAVPGAPGETHTISFTAQAVKTGGWINCAGMDSGAFFGRNIDCVSGTVTP
mgnify:CR=1 FL=1